MQRLTFYLRGVLRIRAKGASPEQLPNRLARARIAFWDLRRVDDLTMELSVFRTDLFRLRQIAKKAMCSVEVLQKSGFSAAFGGLRRRPVLLLGLLCSIALVMLLQHFIWYYDISGNTQVSDLQILAALEASGAGVGTWDFSLDAQVVENHVLALLPELQQITVNLYGGCAEVLVRERDPKPELAERRTPCNLVASRSGLILEMNVLCGDAVVKPGDAVLQGQLLVSGLGDRTLWVQEMHAMGEIYAKTWQKKAAIMPDMQLCKQYTGEETCRYALILGKKRINLSPGSGISGGNCDKMTLIKPLRLPGGILLPVRLEKTVQRSYRIQEVASADPARLLQQTLIHELVEHAVAAEVLETAGDTAHANGLWIYQAVFTCREMIARESEIYKSGEEEYDRTDYQRGTGGADH